MIGHTTDLFYYPIKGLSAQRLDAVEVTPEAGFPFDRCLSLPTGTGHYRTIRDRPLDYSNYHGVYTEPRLVGSVTEFDPATDRLVVKVAGNIVLDCIVTTDEGNAKAVEFFARVLDVPLGSEPFLAKRVRPDYNYGYAGSVNEAHMWACHIVNIASVRDFSERIGTEVDPLRFRANIHVDLGEPWIEREWVGKSFMIGNVKMRGVGHTARCVATEVNLESATKDIPVPRLLTQHYGHSDFGIYATFTTAGILTAGMPVQLLGELGPATDEAAS